VFNASRPTLNGLEAHLSILYKQVRELEPDVVVIDPVSNLTSIGSPHEVNSMLLRLVDFLKSQGITALMTNLTSADGSAERTQVGISSVMDSWLLLRELELNGERNRGLYVLKSRGMAHSNQIREFLMTENGVRLVEVHVGPSGVLTGSARLAQEAVEADEERARAQDVARRRKQLESKRRALEAQVAQLRAAFEAESDELDASVRENDRRATRLREDRQKMVRERSGATMAAAARRGGGGGGRSGGATNGSQRRVRR
jgi:circadian clock protein KaiC